MKKGKKYHGMITAVFLLLYFVSMFFATYLVKEDYTKDYMAYLSELGYEIKECFMDENRIVFSDDTLQYKDRVGAYFKESISLKNMGKDKYQMISMAIYDEKGNLLIHTGNMFGDMFHMYQFEDFFSEDEMEEMIGFYSEKNQEESRLINVGNLYIFLYYIDGYDGPAKVDFRDYLDGEVVYTWLNDEVELEVDADYDDIQSGYLFFPYLYQGRKAWQTWQEDEWLQGFAKKEDVKKIENREYDFYSVSHGTIESEGNRGSVYYLFEWTDYEKAELTANKYGFELRHRIHPWMAAIDYMKYIYLAGVVLLLLCLFIVFYVIRKMNEQKKVMEHQRRDFINAAAHELKTPLGIIRGFAENVKENTVEDKKEYYLNQIIFQTEKMDDLVKEMIGMSKMNTSDMKMDCERISVKGILEEQLEKLQPLMTEKQILLEQDWLDDFVMEGDKNYLGKAFCTTCCAFLL